jgi:hypothetical protein
VPALHDSTTGDTDGCMRLQTYDAGRVLAGQTVRHRFSFQNPTDGFLHLAKASDVRKSCGCTRTSVADQRLAPKQATAIAVHIDTADKRGQLSEVVDVIWTTQDGRRLNCRFAIQAVVDAAIVFSPHELVFTKDEIRSGAVKTVRCQSDLPLNWNAFHVEPTAGYLQVDRCMPDRATSDLKLSVSCRPGESGEHRVAAVRVAGPAPKGSSGLLPMQVVGDLQVFSQDTASIHVVPRFLMFRRSAQLNRYDGHLMVIGDELASGTTVQSVRSHVGQIRYQIRQLSPTAVRLDLQWTMADHGDLEQTHGLDVTLSTGAVERIRFNVIAENALHGVSADIDDARFQVLSSGGSRPTDTYAIRRRSFPDSDVRNDIPCNFKGVRTCRRE